jgi:hypothetical protein
MKADNLFGVYCGGNPMNLPNAPQPIFWEGWTRIANFVNRRDAGGEGTGWVSVAERLPPKFEQVLVNLTPVPEGPNWYPRTNCVLAWQKRGMWFGSFVDMLTGEVKSGEFPDDIITHWQPLPAPPAEPHKCIAEIKLPAGQGFLQCPICGATTGVEPAAEPREP